jgi:hypothetical protein
MRSALFFLAIGVIAPLLPVWAAARPGTVRGTVIDELGQPISGADVQVDAIGGPPRSTPVRYVQTDESGRFLIGDLELGAYKVFAMKEKAGYPNMAFAFYSNHVFPTVNLIPERPTADVVIKLGPKAGVLDLATITDAATGKGIDSATIILRRVLHPDLSISTSASLGRVLVPPMTDVSVEVTAEGYKPWPRVGVEGNQGRIRLGPGEALKLQIQLEPDISEKK